MAVLPFRTIGAHFAQGLALGMAEEVSSALSRFRAPRLIATATFWDGSGLVKDAHARCRTYQLDYVVEGTMQILGDAVRVHVSLLDAILDFEVIWNAEFEGQLGNLFALQHRIASETVAQIDPELFQRAPIHEAFIQTEVPAAHHAVLTAIQSIFRPDQPRFMLARELLEEAIELDPDYAAAYAWLAYWAIMAVGQGWVEDPRNVRSLAETAAERAVLLDPLDARALAIAGHVKAYLLHDVRSAVKLHERAIELNPNLPIAWTLSSWSKIYSGEHVTAIRHAMMAMSLSPRDPFIFFAEHALMTAQFFNRHLEEADMLAETVLERNPRHVSALNIRLAILGYLERPEDARHCLQALQQIDPNVSVGRIVSRAPFRPEDRSFYGEGLRRAGVPESSES